MVLSAKNGVLIVEFANQLRDRGLEIREAVLQAATVRFRPILMTSAATTFGDLPLLLGRGAGWESRRMESRSCYRIRTLPIRLDTLSGRYACGRPELI